MSLNTDDIIHGLLAMEKQEVRSVIDTFCMHHIDEPLIAVNREALLQVVKALEGPDYYIRELQYTRNYNSDNPINILIENIKQSK